jgi:hypothetical protein
MDWRRPAGGLISPGASATFFDQPFFVFSRKAFQFEGPASKEAWQL